MKKSVLFTVLMPILFSCSNTSNQIKKMHVHDTINIQKEVVWQEKLLFSTIIDSIRYFPIPTDKDFLIGKTCKLIVTDSLLNKSEKVYMLVLKDKLTFKDSYRIKQIIKSCKQGKNVCFAVSNKNIGLPMDLNLYYTDETLLKSLVRSPHNGIVIMNNGVVDDVWVFENEY